MKIHSIELAGYKRFRLARLHKVSYRPTARQQLILGTNGSGKSSMLDELSPLPGHHSNYTSGGYKVIEIEHGPHQYVLRSDFKGGNRHSFKKDAVELNEGGTYQVQLRLVKDEFHYTEKLHDLLTGRLKFTEMRPQERREWITMLSERDWTYALGVYNQFRSKARDAQGAYKHQQERLTIETENLTKLTDGEELKTRHQELREQLNTLLKNITPNVPGYSQLVVEMDSLFSRLELNADKLIRELPPFIVDGSYVSLDQILTAMRLQEEQAQYHRIHIERAGKEFSEMDAMLASFGSRNIETIEDAPEQLQKINMRLAELIDEPRSFPGLTDGNAIHSDNVVVLSDLADLFNRIPDNADDRFSRTRIDDAEREVTDNQSLIDKSMAELNRMNDRLSHLKGTHDTTCPRCQLVWQDGVNPKEVEYLEAAVVERTETLSKAREAIRLAKEYLASADEYLALWNRFRGYVTSYPRLGPLWQEILNLGLLKNRPNEQLWVIPAWQKSVELTREIEQLQQRHQQLQQIIEAQELLGDRSLISGKMSSLEVEIREHTVALQSVVNSLEELRERAGRAKEYLQNVAEWNSQLGDFDRLISAGLTAIKNKLLDEDAAIHHMEMASIQKKLSDRATLSGIVDDLTKEAALLEVRYKSYQLLSAVLSPTEGIIADQLRDAIFSIVDQMNTIIASVWTHEMVIQECGFENSDLDYKFPVQVESPDNVTSDISRCSKGQMEMINIAFKLTAMMYLNMLHYPLFLDEPGEGFDEKHRSQIMSLVRQLLDSGHYSQLFMVSHFASNHGSFLDAQILVLDASNIALPGAFNEHAVLE